MFLLCAVNARETRQIIYRLTLRFGLTNNKYVHGIFIGAMPIHGGLGELLNVKYCFNIIVA
jgi:hypothetical protein